MSIENLLSQLIAALDRNTEALNKPFQEVSYVPPTTVISTAPPVTPMVTSSINPTPVIHADPIPVAPVMPAPPSFAPPVMPAAQSVPTALPFNDIAGLIKYATDKFYALGANAAHIGNVIQEMGHSNIEHIPPDQFKIFFDKVEAIKKG